jgi:hypothetical protein
MVKRGAGIILLLAVVSAMVYTQENGDFSVSTELGLQISSVPEFKALVIQDFTFPLLRGTGPLTAENNLKAVFTADFTPVSFNGALELTLTPLAFLQFTGGAKAGSGWHIKFFGADVYGIGINRPQGGDGVPKPRKSEVQGSAFEGLIWSAWGGGAFQFDLAALVPGDWTHVLFRSYHEAEYAAYTRASPEESWFFQADYGENQNGWIYNASYVLAYQMPLSPVLDTIAFMAEMRKNLYKSPNGNYWGEELGSWTFSSLFNFSITPALSAALAVQFHTRRNHGLTDLENKDLYFYQDLELMKNQGERRLIFYRAVVLLNSKLR